MSRYRFETRLANVILYGSVIATLVFFYIPIVTLVAFSFTRGKAHMILYPRTHAASLRIFSELFS